MTDTDTRRRSRQPEGDCRAISGRLLQEIADIDDELPHGAMYSICWDVSEWLSLSDELSEAADRIEALEAQVRTAVDAAQPLWSGDHQAALARIEALEAALREARDLLLERVHGNPARSAGHNARLRIESALSSPTLPAPS